MTVAVVTADLTAAAERELAETFGWSLRRLPRGGIAAADPAGVQAVVIEADPFASAEFDRFPTLSLVACLRGNPVNVDLDAATARGIPVVHAPGRNAEAVADLVLGLTLSGIRHIALTHHLIVSRVLTEEREEPRGRKDVVWRPADPSAPLPYVAYKGPELSRLSLGLLGFGAVARRVAAKATALRMRVLAHDPFVPDERIAAAGVEPVPLDRLLGEVDVLSLHAPPQGNGPLIGDRELRRMKHGAHVINTARASVLDYDALADALRDGRLGGAGLDVFPDEPLSPSSPLLDLPNITFTPHIGGASTHVIEHQSELLLDSLRHLAEGKPEAAAVANREALARLPSGIPAALSGTAR
jgi:D-3-phosphoglycerate dehydrogenase